MIWNYLKTAFAVFSRRKFFTFVSLFGVCITLTVLFVAISMLDVIFGGNPPDPESGRSLGVYRVNANYVNEAGNEGTSSAMASYRFLKDVLPDLPNMESYSIHRTMWTSVSYMNGERHEPFFKYTDAAFWHIMRYSFVEGRPYTQDEVDNADPVAVINESTRMKFFGSGDAINEKIYVDGRSYRVVGVVEDASILKMFAFSDIFVPMTNLPDYNAPNEVTGLWVGSVLADNKASLPLIKEEFHSRLADYDIESLGYTEVITTLESQLEMTARMILVRGNLSEHVTWMLYLLASGVALLFMLLPGINMVNLHVSRILERATEIGVRRSFGATSSALARQFLFENIVLTLLGSVLSLGFTVLILRWVESMDLIPYAKFTLDFNLIVTAIIIAAVFGVVSGVVPAIRMARMNPVDALRGGTV
jgi:putative ABC transport system permease protein